MNYELLFVAFLLFLIFTYIGWVIKRFWIDKKSVSFITQFLVDKMLSDLLPKINAVLLNWCAIYKKKSRKKMRKEKEKIMKRKMIKPPRLKSGATIGIVSPSYHIEEDIYKQTVQLFTERGFNIVEGRSVRLTDNLYSGTPNQRAQDIMDMFTNPEIDAIICARGGYGANRVLPLLDFEVIKQNPKIFIGYSDITAYLTSITQKTGLVTFHGPMLVTYKKGFVKYNYNNFIKCLSGDFPIKIDPPEKLQPIVLKNGKATGSLWGGNLCLLLNRLGTLDQLNTDGAILFIEDIGEQHYRFDRMMVQMKNAGIFDNIKGLLIGELVDMENTDPPFGRTTDEIVMDVCGDFDIPIITNFPCGHGNYQATLPISIPVELDADTESPILTIVESPVS